MHPGSFVGVPLFQLGLEVNLAVILQLRVDLYDFCDILYGAMDRSVPIRSSLPHFCTDPDPVPLPCRLLCTTSSFIADRDHVIPAHACALGARFEGIKFSAFLFDWDADGAEDGVGVGDGDFHFGSDATSTGTGTLWQMVVRLQGIPSDRPTQLGPGKEPKGRARIGQPGAGGTGFSFTLALKKTSMYMGNCSWNLSVHNWGVLF